MDFLQQQDAKKAEELDPGGVETSEGGRVCVVVLCWGVGGCRFWMWFDSGFGFGPGFGFGFGSVSVPDVVLGSDFVSVPCICVLCYLRSCWLDNKK